MKFVSIPNGMEFYFGSVFKMSEAEVCFNSQRDGILQKDVEKWGRKKRVSIPNGMEFYSENFSS